MRRNYIAYSLIFIIFLTQGQSQEYSSIDSPLSAAIDDLGCDKTVKLAQFGQGEMEAARLETFKIDIINSGIDRIANISVVAIIPKGVKYRDSSYKGGSTLERILETHEYDETQNTKIKWELGDLNQKENKSILLRTYLRCSLIETKIKIGAMGFKLNGPTSDIKDIPIVLKDCSCSDKKVNELVAPLIINISTLNNTTCDLFEELVSGKNKNVRSDIFKIDVRNIGEKSIDNLILLAFIPQGMKYIHSSYFIASEADLKVIFSPEEFNETQKTRIRWSLGKLRANETKSIKLETYLHCPVNRTQIELAAAGYVGDILVNTTTKEETIFLNKCKCNSRDASRGNIYIGLRVYNPNRDIKEDTSAHKNVTYNVSIVNQGDIRLENVTVILELTKGMIFKNASYFDDWRGELNVSQISALDDKQKTKVILNIGDLLPGESKPIILGTVLKDGFYDTDIFAMVQGYALDSKKFDPIIDFARTAFNACNLMDENGFPCIRAICGTNCTEVCDGWVKPFLEPSRRSFNAPTIINGITLKSSVYEVNNSTRSVFGFGKTEAASFSIYNITVTNNQDVDLTDLNVNVTMPRGRMIKNTINSDNLEPKVDPVIFNDDSETYLTWNIPNLMKDETKWFIVETYLKKDMNINNTDVIVNITGYVPDYDCSLITASVDRAETVKCQQVNLFGGPCSEADIELKNCTEICPDWEIK
jgi:hypothetical protein